MVYGLLAGIGAITFLYFQPLRLWIDYRHRGQGQDSMFLQVSTLGGLFCYTAVPAIDTKEIPDSRTNAPEAGKQFLERLSSLWQRYRDWWDLWYKVAWLFPDRLRVRRFVWQTELGVEDCYSLALLTGGLWSLKGMVYAGINHLLSFTVPPAIRILPRFNRNLFRVSFSCILEIPLGYAMIVAFLTGFKASNHKVKRKGEQGERTPHTRSDEDSHGEH